MPKLFRPSRLHRIAKARKTFAMSAALKAHLRSVRKAAFGISQQLAKKGAKVNPERMSSAAWMHDLARNARIGKPWGWHERAGAATALAFGFAPEARIIFRHGLIPSKAKWEKFSLEQKLMVYSDARVGGSKIVPLEERAKAVLGRYKPGDKLYAPHVLHYKLLAEFEKELQKKYGVVV